jgi:hypothetical protein
MGSVLWDWGAPEDIEFDIRSFLPPALLRHVRIS